MRHPGGLAAAGRTACESAGAPRAARSTRDGAAACGTDIVGEALTAMQDAWCDEVGVHVTIPGQSCEALGTPAEDHAGTGLPPSGQRRAERAELHRRLTDAAHDATHVAGPPLPDPVGIGRLVTVAAELIAGCRRVCARSPGSADRAAGAVADLPGQGCHRCRPRRQGRQGRSASSATATTTACGASGPPRRGRPPTREHHLAGRGRFRGESRGRARPPARRDERDPPRARRHQPDRHDRLPERALRVHLPPRRRTEHRDISATTGEVVTAAGAGDPVPPPVGGAVPQHRVLVLGFDHLSAVVVPAR